MERSRFDFHMHSSLSDGQDSINKIMELAYVDTMKGRALKAISVTDHNLIALPEQLVIGENENTMVVHPGCEFSTLYYMPEWGENIEVHIVGIWEKSVNPTDFEDIFERCQSGKIEYIQAILDKLATLGIDISMEEVREEEGKTGHLGRHQICNILLRRGYAKSVDDAMDKWVGNWSPYFINPGRFVSYCSMETIVRRILETHGCPILCHPFGYSLTNKEIENLVKSFAVAVGGHGGLEVFYERYLVDKDRMAFLHNMANKYGLAESAASDRHRNEQTFASEGTEEQYRKIIGLCKG